MLFRKNEDDEDFAAYCLAPVRTNEFLYTKLQRGENRRHWVPILLIKPSTLLNIMQEKAALAVDFDYYDNRTDPLQFFLPGYDNGKGNFVSSAALINDDIWFFQSVFAIPRLGEIKYSNVAFTNFIKNLEESIPNFQYYGDMELLLLYYTRNANHFMGGFEYNKTQRYNLSALMSCSWETLNRFLEYLIAGLKNNNTSTETVRKIGEQYRKLIQQNHG